MFSRQFKGMYAVLHKRLLCHYPNIPLWCQSITGPVVWVMSFIFCLLMLWHLRLCQPWRILPSQDYSVPRDSKQMPCDSGLHMKSINSSVQKPQPLKLNKAGCNEWETSMKCVLSSHQAYAKILEGSYTSVCSENSLIRSASQFKKRYPQDHRFRISFRIQLSSLNLWRESPATLSKHNGGPLILWASIYLCTHSRTRSETAKKALMA